LEKYIHIVDGIELRKPKNGRESSFYPSFYLQLATELNPFVNGRFQVIVIELDAHIWLEYPVIQPKYIEYDKNDYEEPISVAPVHFTQNVRLKTRLWFLRSAFFWGTCS